MTISMLNQTNMLLIIVYLVPMLVRAQNLENQSPTLALSIIPKLRLSLIPPCDQLPQKPS